MNCFAMESSSDRYKSSPFLPNGGRLPWISSETTPCTRDQMIIATNMDSGCMLPTCDFHNAYWALYASLISANDVALSFPTERKFSTTLKSALIERADDGT